MVRKLLAASVLLGLQAGAAVAHNHDSRWYVAPYAGANFIDNERTAKDGFVLGLGVGTMLSERFGIEAYLDRSDSDLKTVRGDWDMTGLGLTGRVFLGDLDAGWKPYALFGVGSLKSRVEVPGGQRADRNLEARLGLGLAHQISDNLSARAEAAYRWERNSDILPSRNSYGDVLALIGFQLALGPAPERGAVSPAAEDLGQPMAPAIADPAPAAEPAPAPALGRDGQPIEETITLRGVNFDFDKCTLRPDAIAILNNAVAVLKGHNIRVSVEGHTDWIGTDAYNQKLSECRAKVVYDYLLNQGVPADKITGWKGFGESRPIDTNETAAGRANNRRTELNRQN